MQPWHLWTIAGICLLIAEMLTVSFFAASFGVAALVTALATAQAGLGIEGQLGVFCVASVACLGMIRPLARRLWRHADGRPVLTDAMIGVTATVVDEIEGKGGSGRVRIGRKNGGRWCRMRRRWRRGRGWRCYGWRERR
jgi:membrane protein implicated in regulation of membrane protease activity